MTTPDPARTAARETPEWKATFIDLSDALPFLSGYHTNKLADAIYNAVQRAIPPVPVPSNRPAALPSPASDQAPRPRLHGWWAVFVTDSLAPHQPVALFQYRDQAERWGNDNYRGRNRVEEFCTRDAAPPPSTGDILDRAVAWVEEKYPTRGHATGELLRECIAEISTLRHAARVPLPKQQQPDDRSWEKECEIHANGIVSYPSTALTTRSVYLVPDGRWLTYDQWLLLTPPSDRFPAESAAFSALAKAPRPPT